MRKIGIPDRDFDPVRRLLDDSPPVERLSILSVARRRYNQVVREYEVREIPLSFLDTRSACQETTGKTTRVDVYVGFPELESGRVRPMDDMNRQSDDRELILACRAGESEAFGVLITRYQSRLFPTIVRLVGSVEDAEDVLQDSFIRAYEKLDQFQGESSFYTWIYRIAVNLALSGHRKRRVRSLLRAIHHRIDDGSQHPVDPSVESDPSFPLERAEREKLVQDALNQLGAEHRAVVVLKDFDGRRYEEISAILNVPIGTVRSRLHRARWELRGRLRSLIPDEELIREPSSPGH